MKNLIHAIVLILLFSTTLYAENNTSFRCSNTLISIGDHMNKLLNNCGEPASEKRVGEKTTYEIMEKDKLKIKNTVYVSEWAYEKDGGTYIVTFEGSRVAKKIFIRD